MTKAKDGLDNELARFDYDFERKRISKSSGNLTTNYTYAGNQVVNEFQNNATSASYTIGAGEILKSEFGNGENNYHFSDALGSVTSLANSTGSLTSRNEYNTFGELSTANLNNLPSNNSIGYTGQRLDNETGLMALGNGERYYSPNYARFIQQDRVVGKADAPQSLNRFAYAHNNPNKYTDPSGNAIFIPILAAIAFFGSIYIGVKAVETHDTVKERNEEQIRQGVDPATLPNPTLTAVADNTPFFGSAFRAVTGQDPITGEDLSTTWRVVNGVFAILDVLPFTKTGTKLLDKLGKPIQRLVSWFGRNKRIVEESAEKAPKAVKLFEETAEKVSKRTAKTENLSSTNKSAEILEQLKNNEGLRQARKFGDETSDEIAKGLRQADDLDPYPVRGMADDASGSSSRIQRPVIRENEIATFEDFQARSVIGDQLEGHEILQHAILKREGLATTRHSTGASKLNPVIAVKRNLHITINRLQARLNLSVQTPLQNIVANATILREVGIPRRTIG